MKFAAYFFKYTLFTPSENVNYSVQLKATSH